MTGAHDLCFRVGKQSEGLKFLYSLAVDLLQLIKF